MAPREAESRSQPYSHAAASVFGPFGVFPSDLLFAPLGRSQIRSAWRHRSPHLRYARRSLPIAARPAGGLVACDRGPGT